MTTSIYQLVENDLILHPISNSKKNLDAQLVLCFGAKSKLQSETIYVSLKQKFPMADIAFCSTAGEIYQDIVLDNTIVIVAMKFEKTAIKATSVNIKDYNNSFDAAIGLTTKLQKENLSYLLVLSDGSLVNGSELVKGLSFGTDKKVLITGGLAGDGANFKSTLVGINDKPKEGEIVAIGFYGKNITVTHGSQGGWDTFGLEKTVTKSTNNVLVELEGQNALQLYKKYLGEEAKNLPSAALLYPLSVIIPGTSTPIVRTILSVSEEDSTMTFAGDIPVGSRVRFMKANFDKITYAAAEAAQKTIFNKDNKPDFSLLISCVGRKLILGENINKEIEAVGKTFGNDSVFAGFYSYGEISPFNEGGNCQLHNQTMTITSFYEN